MQTRLAELNTCPRHRSAGFSLIELMIAMLLGLLVVGALGQIYVGGRDVNRIIQSTASLNESGRFAMEFLARDIRLAGFFACGGAKSRVANALEAETFWIKRQGVEGFDGGDALRTSEALPTAFNALPDPLPDTDILVLRHADIRRGVIIAGGDLDTGNSRFVLDSRQSIAQGDVLVLNDAHCTQMALFQATSVETAGATSTIYFDPHAETVTPGNCTDKLAGDYSCEDGDRDLAESHPIDDFAGAQLTPFTARAFFIANQPADACTPTAANCPVISNCPTLYTSGTDLAGAVPVLNDVVDMEVTYGVDAEIDPEVVGSGDASANRYLSSHEVRSEDIWHRVISVHVEFELVGADCRPLRFVTTTALRNSPTGSLLAR